MTGHQKDNIFVFTALRGRLMGGRQGPFLAQNWSKNQKISRYTPIAPFCWAQTDQTQWNHNFPISWGNFGYLGFSGRCPFTCSAGRFMARLPKITLLAWHCMVLDGIAFYLMVLHCIACHCIVSYGISWYGIALYGIAWYCMILHCIVWYCMVLHCIVL